MTAYVAVMDRDSGWKHYEVPDEVYYYIRQLEEYIKHPESSKLKEVYKERFGE